HQRHALIVVGRPDPVVMGLDALMATVTLGRRPSRVVTVDPASGEVGRYDIDMAGLSDVVEVVVGAFAALARTAVGDLEFNPGGHCHRCDHRADCSVGGAWIEARPRRIGGIPVAALSETRSGRNR
ncbi:MAG: hypothetical protein ACYCZM_14415, partial [Acidimicrobiales bacterium]